MDTSLERIRAKITELEEKLANLRIAESELEALGEATAPKTLNAPQPATAEEPGSTDEAASQQTIGATITDVLSEHGSLSVKAIGAQIAALGRVINNRAISFSLQAMKKRGLVKSADGEWTLARGRSKRAR